jgi:N utilization substance protein B
MDFADRLHRGVSDHRHGLDVLIGRFAPAWPVTQLPIVDRNILRIAIFELLHNPATPPKAAIDEAVELAKVFGSDSSARFVNGVLGSVMSSLESGELASAGAAPDGR